VLDRPAPSLLDRYDALVAAGALRRDGAQVAAVEKLERLALALTRRGGRQERGLGGRLLSLVSRPAAPPPPRGVYLWGEVGRGKSTLLDLFYEALAVEKKRRAHFHAFMKDVHERLHCARQSASDGCPVASVAQDIGAETRVLCFDEFAVDDIADATILARLFSALFEAGVVVVATSNVEPARLYEGGRNRDLFAPFIALLETRVEAVRLDSAADYRLTKQDAGEVFFTPADARARAAIDALFRAAANGAAPAPARIELKRRVVEVPHAAGGVARFSFGEICGRPLGAADYLALAERFETIIVENVPILDAERRNEARRFITLIDVLYDARRRLVLSAEAEAEALYRAPHGAEARDFARAVSRLTEMRGEGWGSRQ
jgi:cell division protein ZapE